MTTVPDLVAETLASTALPAAVALNVRRAAEEYATRAGLDTEAIEELVAMLTGPMKPAKTRSSAEKSRARRARLKAEEEAAG